MQAEYSEFVSLASLDHVRAELQPAARRRTPIWPLLLVATVAAILGVSSAGVMILGPAGGVAAVRTFPLSDR